MVIVAMGHSPSGSKEEIQWLFTNEELVPNMYDPVLLNVLLNVHLLKNNR
jgi:hypothetical protein